MTAQTITITTNDDGTVLVAIPQQRMVARHQPLVISQYLNDKNMPVAMIRRKVTNFGKLLRTEYLKERGQEPPKEDRWIGGKLRSVASYTTADRKLFDRVYAMIVTM